MSDTALGDNAAEQLRLEMQEQAILLDEGITFVTQRQSLLRLLSKKTERTWLIKQTYLGTLDYLSAEYIQTDFSQDALMKDGFEEGKRLVGLNAMRCAKIIAIAVLNNRLKIKLFAPLLARYFADRITPNKLVGLARIITSLSNIPDFINAIGYLSIRRTTAPRPVAPTLNQKSQES